MLNNLFLLLLAFLLVLLNAFFVAAEFGMVKLRRTRVMAIKQTHGFKGKILAQVHKHLEAYLSACQLGITLASLGLGWLGEPAFSYLLQPLFKLMGIHSQEMVVLISFFCGFIIISFLHIVIGELVPKSLAIRQSERISLWTAVPLYFFYWAMYPAIWFLNSCANFVLRLARLDQVHKGEHSYSPEEIKLILSSCHTHAEFTQQEIDILNHSIEFFDLKVSEVMRSADEMIALDGEKSIHDSLEIILTQRYSRYPIFIENEPKAIVGIIHIKDILFSLSQKNGEKKLKEIMRPILKVFANLYAIDLLNKLQEGMPHFALVCNHDGMAIGFLTLDNLFQVLVGRVRDEFHKIEEPWTIAPDGGYLMKGNSSLYILERALNIEIEQNEEEKTSDTIFGLIITLLGRLPSEGERIEFPQFTVVVNKMIGHKVTEVLVYPSNLSV